MRALIVLGLLASVAHADDRAKAIELFETGRKEMKAGNYEAACAAFRESNERKPDSGTRGSLAICYEKLGRIASAHALWLDLTKTAPARLRPDAAANAKKLEPRLPRWKVKLAAGAPDVEITIDGVVVAWKPDEAQPIDPGEHVLEANAAGYTTFRRKFTASEGKTEEIAIGLAPIPSTREPLPAAPVEPAASSSTGRKIGFALIGTGGALVIGGAVFGVIAKGRYDDARDLCGGEIDACDPAQLGAAQDKVDSARSAGTLSTVTFIAGAAAIVGGVVLVVKSPKRSKPVAIVPTSNGVAITGAF